MNQKTLENRVNKLAVVMLAGVLLLAGCGLMLPVAPSESERDLSGQFDGRWSLQLIENFGNCKFNFSNRTYLNVKDGIGIISGGQGYIGKTGGFRITANVVYNSNAVNRVFGGNLMERKGRVIVDFRDIRATDCSMGYSINKVP